ncbi:CaiB/BaiF CoA transferase family protein [Sphingomonas sp.]|uniref:CaiB/BaiF CoA transferase family protein n=1 Tax=Sphingomonas sp. TaxID=28214 RepID=UPI003B3AE043
MTAPLHDVRVLDLSRILAGPLAGQVLADLGADVIKVERPDGGDDTRGWGPPFLANGDAAYFLAANRGKRSIRIDIATAEGQALVRRIAAKSDVVLENYKAGGLARYGLDYAGLREAKPDIVYCSITGFGQDGPRANQAAYDFMIQAMGGLMSVTGEADDRPGGGPQKVGLPVVDMLTGLYATTAILAALRRRDATGRGDHIDLALFDVMTASLLNQGMNHLVGGVTPTRRGNRHPNIQPQDVFPTGEGHIVLAVGNDGQFAKLCDVIGRSELASDPRFARNAGRVDHYDALRPLLVAALAARPGADWVALLDAAGVPAAPINSVPQVLTDPQIAHRGMVTTLDHPVAGALPMLANPIRFAEATLSYRRPPPLHGEHDDEIQRQFARLDP